MSAVMQAAFRLVHDYPGGAGALAPTLSKSATTLSHEVSPNYPTAKLGLADAVKLTKYSGDLQVLTAFALDCGAMVVPLAADVPGVEGIGPRTAALAKEFADLMGAVAVDLADGDVSANDLARIEREVGELLSAIQALMGLVRALHQAPGDVPDAAQLRAVR